MTINATFSTDYCTVEVQVLDAEVWEGLTNWAKALFAKAVEADRPERDDYRQYLLDELATRPQLVLKDSLGEMVGYNGDGWNDIPGVKPGDVHPDTQTQWRLATVQEVAAKAEEHLVHALDLPGYRQMAFGRDAGGIRSRQEHPAGRWQSDLWRVSLDEWGEDERDHALPDGVHALTWRAPHQTPPAWASDGEYPVGRVFESEEGPLTVFLRADALEFLGISAEELVRYAQWATGNY